MERRVGEGGWERSGGDRWRIDGCVPCTLGEPPLLARFSPGPTFYPCTPTQCSSPPFLPSLQTSFTALSRPSPISPPSLSSSLAPSLPLSLPRSLPLPPSHPALLFLSLPSRPTLDLLLLPLPPSLPLRTAQRSVRVGRPSLRMHIRGWPTRSRRSRGSLRI